MRNGRTVTIETVTSGVRVRLIPFLFALYVIAYLDRVNTGFAALTMNRDLGLSSEQYGLLTGIFFWGYFLFELPSNLILDRVGARRWIPRILLSWGIVSLVTGFVTSPSQLYLVRFLLGVAEAGFFPGIILYLTYWFRQRDLALTIGLFMTAIPVASVIGAPISSWILDHVHAFSLSGWRWVFILEAFPALVAGVLAYKWLPDGPGDARFLTWEERTLLVTTLQRESQSPGVSRVVSVGNTLRDWRVIHLAMVCFLWAAGMYTASFYMPLSIQAISHQLNHSDVGWLTAIPHALGLLTMILVSRSSTVRRERHLHAGLSACVAAVGFALLGSAHTTAMCVACWSLVTCGSYGFAGPFFAIPGQFLAGRPAAAALATINSIGGLGGFIGPVTVGLLATRSHATAGAFRVVAVSVVCAGAFLLLARKHRVSGTIRGALWQSA